MRRQGWLLVIFVTWTSACTTSEQATATPCMECFRSACALEIDACSQDVACAAYVSCLLRCPAGPDGDADAACEANCAHSLTPASQKEKTRLDHCRLAGAGGRCPACGKNQGGRPWPLAQNCPQSQAEDACWRCNDSHCCHTWLACQETSECNTFLACREACQPLAEPQRSRCQYQCGIDHTQGLKDALPDLNCSAANCSDCRGQTPLSRCLACQTNRCTQAYLDCFGNPECVLYIQCSVANGCAVPDGPCDRQCLARHPGGRLFEALASCMDRECPDCQR